MCRRIRYVADVPNDEGYLCHCRMCQLATGSVSIAFVNVPQAKVKWEQTPDFYASSPIAKRAFCKDCGSSLAFQFLEGKNMDLTIASFDEPRYFRCTSHAGVESRLDAWWHGMEGLKESRTEDLTHITEKWMKTAGKLPSSLP